MRSFKLCAILLAVLSTQIFAQVPTSVLNVRLMGAKGNGLSDDTAAIQSAIDQAKGKPIYLPAGKYVLTSSLSYHTSGYAPGLKVFGDGILETIILPRIPNGSVFDIDGSGTQGQFQMGGYLRDFSIEGMGATWGQTNGVRLTSTWMFTIENLRIRQLSGDGIVIPLRPEYGINPDPYASAYLTIRHTEISFNGGWGVHAENGLGTGGLIIEQCRIGVNAAGGIQTGAHSGRITGNSIFFNGSSGGGGILMQRVQSGGNGFIIEQNEIDSNFAYNIWVQSADTFRIANNRFISCETGWKDGQLHPSVHVRLGGTGLVVRDFVITQNYHRSQNSNTGASANHELTLYDIGDRSNIIGLIERPWVPGPDNTPNLKKFHFPNGTKAISTGVGYEIGQQNYVQETP